MSFQKNGHIKKPFTTTASALSAFIGLAVASTASAGFPTLYGKISVTASQYDFEKNAFALTAPGATTYQHIGATATTTELDNFNVESNGSRLGVQGDFDAAAGLNLFYRIEYGVDVDNGTNSNNGRELTQRNIFGGLRGSWGSVLIGKNDTPIKSLGSRSSNLVKNLYQPAVLTSDIDLFNDAPLADIGSYLVGENRPDNIIQYTFPILLDGLEINLVAIQGEETGVEVSPTNQQEDNGFASGKSISIGYGKTNWFVGVGHETNVISSDVTRAVGRLQLGALTLGAIYQKAKGHDEGDLLGGFSTAVSVNGTTVGAQNGLNPFSEWDGAANTAYSEQDGYVFNAKWAFSKSWAAKIQLADVSATPINTAYEDVDLKALAIGVDHNLNDVTRVFAYHASIETEGDAAISTEATEDSLFALGLDFKF